MRKSSYSLLALLVAFALVSCEELPTEVTVANPDLPAELYGHWRYSTITIMEPSMDLPVVICIAGYLELEADGTWEQDVRVGGENISAGPGTWTADSSTITLKPRRGPIEVWRYRLNDAGSHYALNLDADASESGRRTAYALDRPK